MSANGITIALKDLRVEFRTMRMIVIMWHVQMLQPL